MDIRKNNENKVKKFIAKSLKNKNFDIYTSTGKPSPSKLVELLEKETGITVTRQTIAKYLKDDLSSYAIDVDFSQNTKIKEIKDAMDIAKGLYESMGTKPADKTKAMNAWRQLNQQLIDYEQHLREIEIRKVEAGRPNYLIKIEAACAEYCCSKCHHVAFIEWDETKKKWVEIINENKEKKSAKLFKSGEGQETLNVRNKDEK